MKMCCAHRNIAMPYEARIKHWSNNDICVGSTVYHLSSEIFCICLFLYLHMHSSFCACLMLSIVTIREIAVRHGIKRYDATSRENEPLCSGSAACRWRRTKARHMSGESVKKNRERRGLPRWMRVFTRCPAASIILRLKTFSYTRRARWKQIVRPLSVAVSKTRRSFSGSWITKASASSGCQQRTLLRPHINRRNESAHIYRGPYLARLNRHNSGKMGISGLRQRIAQIILFILSQQYLTSAF